MKRLSDLSSLCKRALEIVLTEPANPNPAVRFQTMCDHLQQEFPHVPDIRIQAAIIGADERKGLI